MQLDVGNEPYLSQQKSSSYAYAIICITSKWYDLQRTTDDRQQTESDVYEPTVQLAQVGLKNWG